MKKRKVAVFTGNRAEFSMLAPIIQGFKTDDRIDYILIVSGAHLYENHGNSLEEIEKEGFEIHHKLPLENRGGTDELSTTKTISEVILKLSELLSSIDVDIMLIASDRFESFGACIAATQLNIPTAHFEGGDITQGGALDDSLRHAMTKLSHFHLTTNQDAADRIIRMGEEPHRVKNVGFPGIDSVASGNFMSENEVIENLKLDINRPIILFTQHSITLNPEKATSQILPSLEALKEVQRELNAQIIITYPNNDAGGQLIINEIEKLKAENLQGFYFYQHLGRSRYYGLLNILGNKSKGVCVGNSSSGIKETPIFNCPSIIIGSRQDGRLRGDNLITVDYDQNEIRNAIKRCILDDEFRSKYKDVHNPYGAGDSSKITADFLMDSDLSYSILNKKMTY
jgi:UDP-N-acetylglucosamine 2-epimerase (non-hydrolysing)/GDP/UDP-N,N'-diacetylbacillosamine 2-epimerase (hydrolysing)